MAQLIVRAAAAYVDYQFFGGVPVASTAVAYYQTVNRKIEGPRLNDLRFTGTEYGECIPYALAGPRISGQVWWASEKRPVANESGGKGGEPQVTTYTYEIDLLIGLTINQIVGVRRIWFNGKLVYIGTDRPDLWRRLAVYTGDDAQDPDPTYEAAVGTANAPAYRGRGSVFFEGLQLDGNGQLPVMTFELGPVLRTTLYAARAFDANQAATTPGGSSETLTISGVNAADQIIVSVVGGAWSRYLGYGSDPGYYPGSIDDPLWQCSFRVKNAAGTETDYFATAYMTEAEALAQATAEITLTGSTSYSIWLYDDVLFNRGSLTLKVEKVDLSSVTTISLQTAVEALCARAGMEANDYDASALSTITQPVRGVAIAQIEPIRGLLDQLRPTYLFDAYLTDKLYFVPSGGAAVRTLTFDEIGAGRDAAEKDPLPITVANDLELPPQVAVQFRNAANDWQTGTEYSDRLVTSNLSAQVVQFGLGLLPAEGKKAADTIVARAHAGIVTAQFSATIKHTDLVPSDVVQLTDRAGKVIRGRIVRRRDDGGVIAFEVVRDDAGAVVSQATTDGDYDSQETVTLPSTTTVLYPLDIPLLRDEDDEPGTHPVAARGATAKWGGADVFSSVNNTDFTNVATVRESAVLGTCTTTLADFAPTSALLDLTNTVTVTVAHGELSSSTEAAMFADQTINVMLIGAEVIRFVTATASDTDPNVYVLSRLFRGQRGTEWAVAGHAASERCVLLRERGLRQISSDIGAERYLKAVTFGIAPTAVTATAFTNTGVASKPWSPVNVQQGENYTITWDRRSRLSTRFASPSGISVPLGEESERYEIDLLTSGDALVTTLESTMPSVELSAASRTLTLPVAVTPVALVGGSYFGVDVEGNVSSPTVLRRLIKQTEAGVQAQSPYIGQTLVDAVITATNAYCAAYFVTAGTPSAYSTTTIQRFSLSDITVAAATYTASVAGDIQGIAHDGTDLWVLEADTPRLRRLNGGTLAVEATHSLGGPVGRYCGLAWHGGDLFLCDSDDLVSLDSTGLTENWRTPLDTAYGSLMGSIFGIVVAGGSVFVSTTIGVYVYDEATGALVATTGLIASRAGGSLQTLFVHGADVAMQTTTGAQPYAILDGATGAVAQRFAIGQVGAIVGTDGTNIVIAAQSAPSAVGFDLAYGYTPIGGSLAGYKVKVYQISAAVGRGYPSAALTLY